MFTAIQKNHHFIIALIITSAEIVGCATSGSYTPAGVSITDVRAALGRGEIRLTCETSCSGAWGTYRDKMKALYDNKLWNDLAILVAKLGFESDQTYYYLGRSAEGLGYIDAALTYYRLAQASFKCDGIINNCDGLAFPNDIDKALERLSASLNKVGMECETDLNCAEGKSCLTKKEPGTECRKSATNDTDPTINLSATPVQNTGNVLVKPKTEPESKATATNIDNLCVKGNCTNGQGTITHPDGSREVGEFIDGKLKQGTITYSDGTIEHGEFSEDGKLKQGTATFANGSKVKFKNGLFNGQGTIISPDGNKWIGDFKDGDLIKGTVIFPNNFKFVGKLKNGLPNQGTMTFANGIVSKVKNGVPESIQINRSLAAFIAKTRLTESEAQKAVLEVLKDPDSAKFGEFSQATDAAACLAVNARNSFGGYTGTQQAFLARIGEQWVVIKIFDKISHESCLAIAINMKNTN